MVTRRGSGPFAAIEVPDHDVAVGSFTLSLPASIDWPAFTLWLSALLHRHGDRILRCIWSARTMGRNRFWCSSPGGWIAQPSKAA